MGDNRKRVATRHWRSMGHTSIRPNHLPDQPLPASGRWLDVPRIQALGPNCRGVDWRSSRIGFAGRRKAA